MPEFVRDNAGKAFEFMVDSINEERKSAGMMSIEDMFTGKIGYNVVCSYGGWRPSPVTCTTSLLTSRML